MAKKRRVILECGHVIDNVHPALFYKGEDHYYYQCRTKKKIVDRKEVDDETEPKQIGFFG